MAPYLVLFSSQHIGVIRHEFLIEEWARRATPLELRTVVALGKVSSYFARSYEVRQQAEVSRLVSDASSDNRWMNAKPLRQLHDREWGRMVLHAARLPHSLWNERLFSPLVRFLFFGVPAYAFDIAQTEIVDERLVALAVHVTPDMRQFMQQTEPEIIEPVIAQRQTDHGRAVHKL